MYSNGVVVYSGVGVVNRPGCTRMPGLGRSALEEPGSSVVVAVVGSVDAALADDAVASLTPLPPRATLKTSGKEAQRNNS